MPTTNRAGGSGPGGMSRRSWAPEFRLEVARAVVERRTPQTEVARVFGVPLTTVMDWTQRYRKEGAAALLRQRAPGGGQARTRSANASAAARRKAVTEAKRAQPDHGTRKIRDVLARLQGLGVSETTVRRILHEDGLLEDKPALAAKVQPERRFERAEPNQLWQSDIFTFLLRRHERIYVTAFMDDYSRYLVSLVIAHHQRSTLVLESLSRAIADYGDAAGGPDRPGPAVHGVARHDRLRRGAEAPGHPSHQEPGAPPGDAGKDRALLEDLMGGAPVADRLCGLRGLPAAGRTLRPGL